MILRYFFRPSSSSTRANSIQPNPKTSISYPIYHKLPDKFITAISPIRLANFDSDRDGPESPSYPQDDKDCMLHDWTWNPPTPGPMGNGPLAAKSTNLSPSSALVSQCLNPYAPDKYTKHQHRLSTPGRGQISRRSMGPIESRKVRTRKSSQRAMEHRRFPP